MGIFKAVDNEGGKDVEVEITAEVDETPYMVIYLTDVARGGVMKEIVVDTREDADNCLAAVTEAHREFIEMLDRDQE